MDERDPRTSRIIGAAIEVHRLLGPGLLESAYEACLCQELSLRGVTFASQVPIPLRYKGAEPIHGFRADLVAEGVLVEIKAVERLLAVHEAQLLTYLRLSGLEVGLLLNFHATTMKNGILRRVRTAV